VQDAVGFMEGRTKALPPLNAPPRDQEQEKREQKAYAKYVAKLSRAM
jgi:hypothetical protein